MASLDTQVVTWLRSAGLSRFSARFGAANVSTARFLDLSPRDLDRLGLDSPADRKRLADLITELRRARALPDLRPVRIAPSSTVKLQRRVSGAVGRSMGAAPKFSLREDGTRERAAKPSVRVCVRKRPLAGKDVAAGEKDIVSGGNMGDDGIIEELFVHEVKTKLDLSKYVETHQFAFDTVFTEDHDNADVYAGTARPLVDAVFEGWRSTVRFQYCSRLRFHGGTFVFQYSLAYFFVVLVLFCAKLVFTFRFFLSIFLLRWKVFCYGQTGTGKTHTCAGSGYEPGLYFLAVQDIFSRLYEGDNIGVWISFYEIYGTRLHDLLNKRKEVQCREDTSSEVHFQGLTEKLCESPDDVLDLIELASRARSTGVTGANDDSSRSHAVFQIELRQRNDVETEISHRMAFGADETTVQDEEIGRLSFIDLAGSERGNDTANNTLQTRREGAEINKSLLALKECIRAMDQGKNHTPFRGSKLTQVLKASFVGRAKCRTVMIANISPASLNVEHTLNTLRYSQRVRAMKATNTTSPDRDNFNGGDGAVSAYSYGVPASSSAEGSGIPPRNSKPRVSSGGRNLTRRLSGGLNLNGRGSNSGTGRTGIYGSANAKGHSTMIEERDSSSRARRALPPASKSMIPGGSGRFVHRRSTITSGPSAAEATGPPPVLTPPVTRAALTLAAPVSGSDDPGSTKENEPGIATRTRRRALRNSVDEEVSTKSSPSSMKSGDTDDFIESTTIDPEDLLYTPIEKVPATPVHKPKKRIIIPASARRPKNTRTDQRKPTASMTPVSTAKPLSDEAMSVVALHRQSAEELTKLLRQGVELMQEVETGAVKPDAYATKLEVNLAMSMQLVHTLKQEVANLGLSER